MLFYVEQSGSEVYVYKWCHVWFHVYCLVHGVWCSFQGWDVGTLGNTLSGCVTQDLGASPSETCAIHPNHPVHLFVCTSEP